MCETWVKFVGKKFTQPMSKSTELTSFDFNYRRYREKDKDKLQPLTVHTCCLWSQAQLFKYWMQLNSRISGFLTFRVLFCYFFFLYLNEDVYFFNPLTKYCREHGIKARKTENTKKEEPFFGIRLAHRWFICYTVFV